MPPLLTNINLHAILSAEAGRGKIRAQKQLIKGHNFRTEKVLKVRNQTWSAFYGPWPYV